MFSTEYNTDFTLNTSTWGLFTAPKRKNIFIFQKKMVVKFCMICMQITVKRHMQLENQEIRLGKITTRFKVICASCWKWAETLIYRSGKFLWF